MSDDSCARCLQFLANRITSSMANNSCPARSATMTNVSLSLFRPMLCVQMISATGGVEVLASPPPKIVRGARLSRRSHLLSAPRVCVRVSRLSSARPGNSRMAASFFLYLLSLSLSVRRDRQRWRLFDDIARSCATDRVSDTTTISRHPSALSSPVVVAAATDSLRPPPKTGGGGGGAPTDCRLPFLSYAH